MDRRLTGTVLDQLRPKGAKLSNTVRVPVRLQRVVLAGAAGCKAQLGSRAAQAPRPEAEQTLRVVCMWTHPVRHAAAAYVC